jgi:hypothetical protein
MAPLAVATAALALLAAAPALAEEPPNGSFETGTLDGWTASTSGSGAASVEPGGAPGQGSFFGQVIAGPEGEYQSLSKSFAATEGDTVVVWGAFFNAEDEEHACDDVYNDDGQVLVYLNGELIATIVSDNSCDALSFGTSGRWVAGLVTLPADGVVTVVARVRNVGDGSVASAVGIDGLGRRWPHRAYCSVEGNTHPFTGQPIAPGTFLDLKANQPLKDPNYKGAVPAIYVEGKGLTCDAPPAGYVLDGLAGEDKHVSADFYPYYRPAS